MTVSLLDTNKEIAARAMRWSVDFISKGMGWSNRSSLAHQVVQLAPYTEYMSIVNAIYEPGLSPRKMYSPIEVYANVLAVLQRARPQ